MNVSDIEKIHRNVFVPVFEREARDKYFVLFDVTQEVIFVISI